MLTTLPGIRSRGCHSHLAHHKPHVSLLGRLSSELHANCDERELLLTAPAPSCIKLHAAGTSVVSAHTGRQRCPGAWHLARGEAPGSSPRRAQRRSSRNAHEAWTCSPAARTEGTGSGAADTRRCREQSCWWRNCSAELHCVPPGWWFLVQTAAQSPSVHDLQSQNSISALLEGVSVLPLSLLSLSFHQLAHCLLSPSPFSGAVKC